MSRRSEDEAKVVLTSPFSIDGESEVDYKAPNLIHRISSLFKNARPGSDLTHFKLPPQFNFPKSHLQCYGEMVYCSGSDMLSRCNLSDDSLDRFMSVVAWSISTLRLFKFGFAPYNPVLGETHHVSRATLNVLLEQISHHPPISALHATDEENNIEIIWCQQCVSKFNGASVDTEVRGKRQLKLLNRGETYEMNSPNLLIRFLPLPGAEWTGIVRIKCKENGLEAELRYGPKSFLGLGGSHRSVKGKIYETSTKRTLFELNGHWDRTVTVKDNNSGKFRVIYNADQVFSGLKAPVVDNLQGVELSESAAVWSEVSEAIMSQNWEKAKESKNAIEEKQRETSRERESKETTWSPQHFRLTYSKDDGCWDCSPIQQWVPSAPIVVPHS